MGETATNSYFKVTLSADNYPASIECNDSNKPKYEAKNLIELELNYINIQNWPW